MALTNWSPAENELSNFSQRMNSLLDEFFGEEAEKSVYRFDPALDIQETDETFEINAELPGLDKSDINIKIEKDVLTLSGEKTNEYEEKDTNCYRSERVFGKFQRSFRLPDIVEQEDIEAEFDNGILQITIPKAEETVTKSKQIDIK